MPARNHIEPNPSKRTEPNRHRTCPTNSEYRLHFLYCRHLGYPLLRTHIT